MNHMIYIAKAVQEKFKGEPNKSGLVNDLLLAHYGEAQSSQARRHYPERLDYPTPPKKDEADAVVPSSVPACCKRSDPCKHWVYDGGTGVRANLITKERKEVL